jgi:hypothetical protein
MYHETEYVVLRRRILAVYQFFLYTKTGEIPLQHLQPKTIMKRKSLDYCTRLSTHVHIMPPFFTGQTVLEKGETKMDRRLD